VFAVFTKLAWMVLQPSSLIIGALFVGVVLLWRRRFLAARRWMTGALLALFLIGWMPLGDLLIAPLEDRFPRPDLTGATIDGLVVLGGAEDAHVANARKVIAVSEAAGRYIEAAALALRFPKARLLFSGGGDALDSAIEPETVSAARIFAALGIPRERITFEDKSRTTWENAQFSASLIAQKPYPVDYRTTGRESLFRLNASPTDGLRRFDGVVREYPGLLVYWLTGRSSALFPAP
jgi:uncharacterized SAM-binding protein YcdF (DUF218 family)